MLIIEVALKEFQRVLKKSGTLYVLIFLKQITLYCKIFDFTLKILPKIGGIFSDRTAYEYLPNSVSTMPC